jgi:hypothetical protein
LKTLTKRYAVLDNYMLRKQPARVGRTGMAARSKNATWNGID